MKNLVITAFFLAFSIPLIAQSIKIKKEEAFVDKDLYCYIERGGNIMSVWTYTVKGLDKTELIFMKSNTIEIDESTSRVYYTVTILETDETFEMEQTLSFKKDLVKGLYKYEVIKNNKIDEEGLKRFKQLFAEDFESQFKEEAARLSGTSTVNVNNGNTEDYVIVERNTSWEIFVINGVIKQQNVEIATYKTETEAAAGKIFKIVKIYNVNNQLVAQLKFENFEKEVSIITLKDNKKYNVSSKTNFEDDKIKESMQLLIEYLYI